MIRVAALTAGQNTPSSRFRVRQHVELLREAGIDVREYIPAIDKNAPLPLLPHGTKRKYVLPLYAAWQTAKVATRVPHLTGALQSHILWLQRELLPGYLTLEPLLVGKGGVGRHRRPAVLDVDDAIWTARPFGPKGVAYIARHVDVVVAGNSYLADWFSRYAHDIRIVPTAIDTDRFRPRDDATAGSKKDRGFVVGWSGLSSNLKYMYAIEAPLRRFLERYPDARLRIIADAAPVFKTIAPERVEWVRWTPEVEAESVRTLDVGLMPLPDDEWTRGKCSFKMLQYMACAVPVVVSPVGMNRDVLALDSVGYGPHTDDEWFDALDSLYRDREAARTQGQAGLSVVQKHYSRAVVAAQIATIFQGLATHTA